MLVEIQRKFFDILNKPSFLAEGEEDLRPRILSFLTDPDGKFFGQTAAAALKPNGDIAEITSFTTLSVRKVENLHESDRIRYSNERKKLIKLILEHQPNIIVIGANCLQSLQLRKTLGNLCEYLTLETFNELEIGMDVERAQLFAKSPVIAMEDVIIAKLFATSQRSTKMCENYNLLTRMAISLGRYVQNPRAETLGLWTDPNELQIKNLNLHSLQSLVSDTKRLAGLEMVAVDICSQYGVNVNEIINKPHLQGPLPFIPGLGPVRAYTLLEGIRYKCKEKLTMRAQLIGKRILSQRVYDNCCAFIRIAFDEGETDPLDSTRIHPESYELAKIVSKSAISDERIREENLIQDIMAAPHKMRELDLDVYAQLQAERGKKNMKEVLEFLVLELTTPFGNPKRNYSEPTADELLYMTTKETRQTLKKGSIVQVMVIMYDEKKQMLRCLLECELDGDVDANHIVEGRMPEEEDLKRFTKGEKLNARILDISAKLLNQKELVFRVKLSLLPEDVINHGKFIHIQLDDAFVMEDSDWTERAVKEDEQVIGLKYVPRVVNHPKYRNIGLRTACDELSSKDIGECIFRPSSRGQDHLTCT